jgi:hypothetical protein
MSSQKRRLAHDQLTCDIQKIAKTNMSIRSFFNTDSTRYKQLHFLYLFIYLFI